MVKARRLTSRTRWAVPAGAIAVVGLVAAGSIIASAAAATPTLPARSAAQLLAAVAKTSAAPSSLSGVIVQTAALGLPQLPNADGGSSGLGMLAGSHTYQFWSAGPTRVRIAVPVQLGETDLRRDGSQVWLWDSTTDTATHILPPLAPPVRSITYIPAHSRSGRIGKAAAAAAPWGIARARAKSARFSARSGNLATSALVLAGPTPQQVARQVLAAVGPTTTVRLQQNVTVAGQAAYQLALAPKDSRSLIGQIRIAIDARRYLPLRLQVFARGASSPAYQIGFTALSFARPAASNFVFTPPPGAKVKTVRLPAPPAPLRGSAVAGNTMSGFSFGHPEQTPAQPAQAPQIAQAVQNAQPQTAAEPAEAPPFGAAPTVAGQRLLSVVGKGWLSVIVLRLSGASLSAAPGGAQGAISWQSASAADGPTAITVGPPAEDLMVLRALLRSATPVHGSWGSGRLLRTSLLSVLFTTNGRVLIGAVAPSVLYADAAKVK